jgi:hypothetical protein
MGAPSNYRPSLLPRRFPVGATCVASSKASVIPTGPAPAIKTEVCFMPSPNFANASMQHRWLNDCD